MVWVAVVLLFVVELAVLVVISVRLWTGVIIIKNKMPVEVRVECGGFCVCGSFCS